MKAGVKRKQQHFGERFLMYLLGGCLQAYQAARCSVAPRSPLKQPKTTTSAYLRLIGGLFLVSQAFLIAIT